MVALIHAKAFKNSPDNLRPLFTGRLERKLSFSVAIAEKGDHYLLLDNRRGTEARAVTVTLQAARSEKDRTNELSSFEALAKIVWKHLHFEQDSPEYEYGAEYTHISEEDKQRLMRLLSVCSLEEKLKSYKVNSVEDNRTPPGDMEFSIL